MTTKLLFPLSENVPLTCWKLFSLYTQYIKIYYTNPLLLLLNLDKFAHNHIQQYIQRTWQAPETHFHPIHFPEGVFTLRGDRRWKWDSISILISAAAAAAAAAASPTLSLFPTNFEYQVIRVRARLLHFSNPHCSSQSGEPHTLTHTEPTTV